MVGNNKFNSNKVKMKTRRHLNLNMTSRYGINASRKVIGMLTTGKMSNMKKRDNSKFRNLSKTIIFPWLSYVPPGSTKNVNKTRLTSITITRITTNVLFFMRKSVLFFVFLYIHFLKKIKIQFFPSNFNKGKE